MRLKSHESPRKQGRNIKGASTPKILKRLKRRHKNTLKKIR